MKQVILLTLAILPPLCAAEDQPDFEYAGWFDRDTLQFFVNYEGGTDGRIGYHDSLNIAEMCDATSDYWCFFSMRLAFAVPKKIDKDAAKWTVRGETFELVRRDLSISLLGMKLDHLLLIRAPASATLRGRESGKASFYLYSQELGLVGFGDDPALEASKTYWLAGTKGYGAASP